MSNKRFIIFFIIGIIFFSGILFLNDVFRGDVATVETRATLSNFDPNFIDRINVSWPSGNMVELVASENRTWKMVKPFAAETDAETVNMLLDSITLTQPTDMISDSDVLAMGRKISDFGFSHSKVEMVFHSKGKTSQVFIGDYTASKNEVYARVEGVRNVFVMPAEIIKAIPVSSDGFRRRDFIGGTPNDIAEIEFRTPGAPFVKVVNDGLKWRLEQPFSASADTEMIRTLAERLISSRILGFVFPSASRPLIDVDIDAEGKLRSPGLVPFSLDAERNVSVTVRTKKGKSEQVVFGNSATSNSVYALVHGATAVVQIDSEIERLCKVSGESLRDMRIFPILGSTVDSLSVTFDSSVYVLRHGDDGKWYLDSPVMAMADQKTASSFVDRILRLKQNDLSNGDDKCVQVSVSSSITNFPPVSVPLSYLDDLAQPMNLRSRQLMELNPETVKVLEVKGRNKTETVVFDAVKGAWMRKRSEDEKDSKVYRIKEDTIKNIIKALSNLKAVGIETIASTPADFERCGLKKPFCVVSVDVNEGETARKNIILGGATSSGGRYVTLGGIDTIFILSRKDVMILTESLTE
ncbi:MAG: DUF4340 domain-containing protein [Kiritimatiellae bacterium]|nr:DUF4340 domain-containing protein [Kiritimatiellia bacterium]